MAKKADKYALYLASVQDPEHEVWFFHRVFKKEFKRTPLVLREDFCGTAAVCYDWVKKSKEHRAIGVDIDPEPLNWGREHLAPLIKAKQLERVTLLQDDVRKVQGDKADMVGAQNFSFWCFKDRQTVTDYFRTAYANLKDEGIFLLDMMGGSETLEEDRKESSDKETEDGKKFEYVWEQERFDPITHDCRFHIHFKFRDGSRMKRAFTYEWRLWTIPEVREMLLEAGFGRVDVYWEDTGEDGEGNGNYRVRKHAESDPAWVSYMVAVKK
ncbi:MAG: class I SAM-dependent methyltransferase [Phycisphaera sp.]|nr:class I SAM-dependent methyltransferase [Phycisphaera sp.]